VYNLALSDEKRHQVEIVNYTRIIEQLVLVLQINANAGDNAY